MGMGWNELDHAIEAREWERALELALDLWRARRRAPLAELIDTLAARASGAPIRGSGAPAFQAAWLARAKKATATDLGPLVGSIVRSLPVAAGGRYYAQGGVVARHVAWLDRIRALSELPDDPRSTFVLLDVLRKAPWGTYYPADTAALYDPAFDLLARIADERVIAEARTLVERPTSPRQTTRDYLATALPKLIATVEERQHTFRPLDQAESALCERLLESLGGSPQTQEATAAQAGNEAALLELVLANPDDDDARAVLADHWLERDDPRGRFIALQLAREGMTEADRKAEGKLLREHEKSWLDDIALVTKSRVWRRGFLDELELLQNSAADRKVWESVPLDPRLGTVRIVHKGKANETHYRRFVFSPTMRSLRELTVVSKGMLRDACERAEPWTIEHLSLSFMPDKKSLAAIAGSSSFPSLSRLTVGVTEGNVSKVIELVADFARKRPLEQIGVTPFRWYQNLEPLRGWLSATLTTLAHVPSIELSFGHTNRENRILARRGTSGLQLELVCEHVYSARLVVPALQNVERAFLRVPEGGEPYYPNAAEVRILFENVPREAVELDPAWTAAFESATRPLPARHRDA